jgi:mannan endo-1,4-beta-mannosidase
LHFDPSRRARSIAALLLSLCVCWLLAGPTQGAPDQQHHRHHHKRKRHPRPIYWGAWIGKQLTGTDAPWDMNAVDRFESVVGKGLSLVEFSSAFEDCSRRPCRFFGFPAAGMESIRRYGAIPFFSWGSEAIPRTSAEQPAFQLADIADGAYDGYIRSWATEAREWGHPLLLRFDWEMNGNWLPWGEAINGNGRGQFVTAWRHVHDIFTSVGATNVSWVWCPYADTPKRLRATPLKPLYPGSAYVDWTCLDGYNWGSNPVNPRPWRSFREIFEPAYKLITKRVAPHKPLLLGEFASSPYGGHKALWVRRMFEQIPWRFPRVRGMIYFDVVDRGVDWPLETSATAASAFAAGVARKIFAGNRFGELSTSPIPPLR